MNILAGLKPYPSYKDSRVEWLGEVPEHWEVVPNRAIFEEIKDSGFPDEEMLSVTIRRGVIKQSVLLEETSKKDSSNLDRSKYKLVQPGDIAYNKMRAWQVAVGVSDYRGIISPAYIVQRLRGEVEPMYFHHLLRIPTFAKEAERCSYGITSDMWSLRSEHFKLIYTCLPPLPEQIAIVRFLKYIDQRIRNYITAKERLIILLEEQKQAIIHQAVTRGLDPDMPRYPSGVAGIGNIPENWVVRSLSSICNLIVDGTHFSPVNTPTGDFLYITAKNIKEAGINLTNISYISANDHYHIYRRCPVEKGDVLYIKDGATAGLATVNNLDDEFSLLSSVALIKPNPNILSSEYLKLSLNEISFKDQVLRNLVGGAMTRFTLTIIKRFKLRLPPRNEQELILKNIAMRIIPLGKYISVLNEEIYLIKEYRTKIISDVVTGKLDVRKAVLNLPKLVDL